MSKPMSVLVARQQLECTNDYYNYIIESMVNGNRSQVIGLYKDMRVQDRKNFVQWLLLNSEDYGWDRERAIEILTLLEVH